jgi:hypothetical protein
MERRPVRQREDAPAIGDDLPREQVGEGADAVPLSERAAGLGPKARRAISTRRLSICLSERDDRGSDAVTRVVRSNWPSKRSPSTDYTSQVGGWRS